MYVLIKRDEWLRQIAGLSNPLHRSLVGTRTEVLRAQKKSLQK